MDVFDLFAKISLDTTEYENGLDRAKSLAGGLATALGGAMVAASGAVIGLGKSAVDAGMEFDASMSQVAATMGKTVNEMMEDTGAVSTSFGEFSGNLREYAQFMGANTAFSASQAADALNYMALAGYNTQQSMEMLPNVLNLAAAGGMGLASASDMITDAQTALGLSFEETNALVDQMAKTASTTNTSVSQLGAAMLTIGATARNVSGGTVELSEVLGILADNGIKASEGGTHLRNAILSLQTPTKDGAAALAELGMSYENMYDEAGNMRSLPEIFQEMSAAMEGMTQQSRDSIIGEIFNKTDLAAINALIGTTAERWDQVEAAISDASGSAAQMAEVQLDNLAGDITIFQSALEGAQIAISDQLTPSLRDFVQLGTNGLSDVTEAFKEDGLEGAFGAFGGFLANGLSMIIEKVPEIVSAGAQLLGALGQGIIDNADVIIAAADELIQMFFNAMLSAGDSEAGTNVIEVIQNIANMFISNIPLIVQAATVLIREIGNGIASASENIIPIISELVAVIANALTNPTMLTSLVNAAIVIIQGLANGLIAALPVLVNSLPTIIDNIVDTLVGSLPLLINGITTLISSLASALPTAITSIIRVLPTVIRSIVGAIVNNLPVITQGIITLINMLVTELPTMINEIVSALPGLIEEITSALLENVPLLIEGLIQMAIAIGEQLPTIIETLMVQLPVIISVFADAIPTIIEGLISATVELVPMLVDGLFQIAMMLVEHFPEIAAILMQQLPGFFDSIINSLKSFTDRIWAAVGSIFAGIGEILGRAWESFKAILPQLWELIIATLGEIWIGLEGWWNDLKELFNEKIQAIKDFFDALPYAIGYMLADIVENTTVFGHTIEEWINGAFAEMIENFLNFWAELPGKIWDFLTEIVDNISTWVSDMIDKATEEIPKFIDNLVSWFEELPEKALTWGKDMIDGFINGIVDKAEDAWDAVKDFGQGIVDRIGFSEPKIGPLSNFHTYAPDMIDLFIQGVRENEKRLKDQINSSFDFQDIIADNGISANISWISANISGTAAASGARNNSGIVQNIIINAPTELDPFETARLQKLASQELYLGIVGAV